MAEITDEIRKEAKALGWADKEEWRGDPNHWVDADVFVDRGRTILPIVKENNARLQDTVSRQQAEIDEMRQKLQESQASMEDFKKFHGEELQRKVAETKRELRKGIEEARKEGNTDAVVEMQEQLDKLTEAATPPPAANGAPPKQEPPKIDPDFVAWQRDNSWYGQDPIETSLANGIAVKLRQDPANKDLLGRAFYDRVAKEMEAYKQPTRRSSKMEGGAGERSSSSSTSTGFDALPAEAQSYARAEAKKYVGPNKMFKTDQDWFKYYADHY